MGGWEPMSGHWERLLTWQIKVGGGLSTWRVWGGTTIYGKGVDGWRLRWVEVLHLEKDPHLIVCLVGWLVGWLFICWFACYETRI